MITTQQYKVKRSANFNPLKKMEQEIKAMRIEEQNRHGKAGYCLVCGLPIPSKSKYCSECIH